MKSGERAVRRGAQAGASRGRPRRARTPGGSGRSGAARPARAAPPLPARRRRSRTAVSSRAAASKTEPSPPTTPAREDSSASQARVGGAATRTSWTLTYGKSSTPPTVIGRATDASRGRVHLAFSVVSLTSAAFAHRWWTWRSRASFVAFTVAEAVFSPGRRAVVARGWSAVWPSAPAGVATYGSADGRPPRGAVNVVTNPEASSPRCCRWCWSASPSGPRPGRPATTSVWSSWCPSSASSIATTWSPATWPPVWSSSRAVDRRRRGPRPRRERAEEAVARPNDSRPNGSGGRAGRRGGAHPDRPRAARHRVPLDQRGDHPDPGRTTPARPRASGRGRRPRRRRGDCPGGARGDAAAVRRAAHRRRVASRWRRSPGSPSSAGWSSRSAPATSGARLA